MGTEIKRRRPFPEVPVDFLLLDLLFSAATEDALVLRVTLATGGVAAASDSDLMLRFLTNKFRIFFLYIFAYNFLI